MLPPAYFFLAIALMAGLHWLWPIVRWIPTPWNVVGALPLLGGVVLAVMGNRLFHKHGTPLHPFAEASTLVVGGPFRYSRNPMYLGMALALIGIAALLGSLTPWLVIPPFIGIIDQLFIRKEERALEQRFGEAYAAYRQKVRRWM